MADKRISQLIERTDILNNDVLPIVASGATTTNKVTISTIQDWMQENLDVGVTSVGITIGSTGNDVNVSGSPITTSGNITINIPTATATARGLLSSTDWSTFNGKQNSITLTTSGTSGAATLVGSTLNIPNYSTGVANSYVPYVGAIGSVTLGYNSLSASQINIDGASPTGGSYLGFKHSTSVNSGTSGYTSMYTFGTNTIAFKSVTGADSKDFSFSMVGITPNVPGGRQYTLPDASGTLALTSDLSGYVTLGTAQTITGSKTFNSRIIGQDATLTGSGSADTLEVTHTSGSGIAVDISKAGNGEGLRVAKTSGSGNAVTISGGLLSAEAATLSGALNGTSASFTSSGGSISISNASDIWYNLTRGSSITNIGIDATGTFYNTSTNHRFLTNSGSTTALTLASTGAATFSSSVTASSFSLGSGNGALSTSGFWGTQLRAGTGSYSNFALLDASTNGIMWNPTGTLNMSFAGNVGIGTALPNRQLTLSAPQAVMSFNATSYRNTTIGSDATGSFIVYDDTAAAYRMVISSAGNTQPGADNAYSLGVSGTRWSAVWAANGTIQTSDEREKKEIVDSDLGLDFVNQLRPVSFKWKVGQNVVTSEVVKDEEGNPILDEKGNEKIESVITPREGKRTHYGLIAQEVEKLLDGKDFGGFIHDKDTDTKGLRYDQFVPILIKSIQEQQEQIKSLTEQVEALKSQING